MRIANLVALEALVAAALVEVLMTTLAVKTEQQIPAEGVALHARAINPEQAAPVSSSSNGDFNNGSFRTTQRIQHRHSSDCRPQQRAYA
jgi:hypothetical protein